MSSLNYILTTRAIELVTCCFWYLTIMIVLLEMKCSWFYWSSSINYCNVVFYYYFSIYGLNYEIFGHPNLFYIFRIHDFNVGPEAILSNKPSLKWTWFPYNLFLKTQISSTIGTSAMLIPSSSSTFRNSSYYMLPITVLAKW